MWIAIAVGAVIVLLIIIVALQPADFKIERSTAIAATPDRVFPYVNNLHLWNEWSPWAKIDPELKMTYDGPKEGTGAMYAWSGNNKVGQGKMTIIESRPDELVRIQLEFIKPWSATNAVAFTLSNEGEETHVNWAMTGRNNFMAKGFGLLMNMDKMVGNDFDKGLATLKSIVEENSPSRADG